MNVYVLSIYYDTKKSYADNNQPDLVAVLVVEAVVVRARGCSHIYNVSCIMLK